MSLEWARKMTQERRDGNPYPLELNLKKLKTRMLSSMYVQRCTPESVNDQVTYCVEYVNTAVLKCELSTLLAKECLRVCACDVSSRHSLV